MKKIFLLLAFIGIAFCGVAQTQYQVSTTSKTKKNIPLSAGFILEIETVRIQDSTIAYSVVTLEAIGKPVLADSEEKLLNSVQVYLYDPSKDDLKSLKQLKKDTFEVWLDDTFGAGNWVKL